MKRFQFILLISIVATNVYADSTKARCDIYVTNAEKPYKVIECDYSQRQGYITISRNDGVIHDLSPVENAVGTFIDQNNKLVYRQSGLGSKGLIFRFAQERVFVYWDSKLLVK